MAPTESDPLPALTAAEMAAVDRMLVEEFGLDVVQVMEVAGRAVAVFARAHLLGGDPRGKRVVVLAGSGGNGGDGLVAARYLHVWGAEVEIRLGRRPERGPAAHNLRAAERLGLPIVLPTANPRLPPAALLIDALLGFSLVGAPTGETAALIVAANAQPAPILAVDLPSGLEATGGTVHDPCIVAAATLTLALPKQGLVVPGAGAVVGELFVADIGVPAAAYRRIGHDVGTPFADAEIVPVPRSRG